MPSDLDTVVAIAAGSSYSLALKENGDVIAWGMDENYYNYFISGSSEDYTNITVPNTTKGRSSGIDGGFGLFGSIASDAVLRIVIP